MTKSMFLLFAVSYYVVTMLIIAIVLFLISSRNKKRFARQINELERQKNLVISASILSELNKVESLVNNEELKKQYDNWKERFNEIKDTDIPKITDSINEVQTHYDDKDYRALKIALIKSEMDLNFLKTKADFLLDEIKKITLSEERNREKITKLKAEYRDVMNVYTDNINDFEVVKTPLQLQFENADKLFASFEIAMEKNEYTEVGKIVKAIDNIVANLKAVTSETKTICQLGQILIPKKIADIKQIYGRMNKDGYNLDYLKIAYNIDVTKKKVKNIFQRLNVLDVEDSVFELKTILDYFDSLYNDFEKERNARKSFDDYSRSILIKSSKLEKINNEIYKKMGEIKYNYDLSDEEVSVIPEIRDELIDIKTSYDSNMALFREGKTAFSKLNSLMDEINNKLIYTEEKLNITIRNLSSFKDDELRAKGQLEEIKKILFQTKEKANIYNLPVIREEYYIELNEAIEAINAMTLELEKRPMSIKTLNTRVDTARDLVLKVYNTINEMTKTAKMAEMAIVYGNRYRTVNKEVDYGLTKAEASFLKGSYKSSLKQAISSINIVEPGIYKKLLNVSNK
ncbi:MAG: hypothetical protein GX951_01115 [Mollicutes bacterium]|nr:hypothetical protein [Mollicutes bacterium]